MENLQEEVDALFEDSDERLFEFFNMILSTLVELDK